MKTSFLGVLILFVSMFSYSQEQASLKSSKEAKNGVVFSAGTVVLVSNLSASYERKLTSLGVQRESSLWIKARVSKFSGWIDIDHGQFVDATLFTLLGSGRSFSELSLGIGMFPGDLDIMPTGSVGYRFQKKGGGIIFRTGAGYPEIFYVGLGYSF